MQQHMHHTQTHTHKHARTHTYHKPSVSLQSSEARVLVLGSHGSSVFSFSSLLQEIRQQLNSDHRDKMETLEIDRGCLSLNLTSPNISLKVNPTRIPKE